MIKIVAEMFIKPDAIDTVKPLCEELVAASRSESACISYELFVNPKEPGHFVFVEGWQDQAAIDRHMASEHFKRIFPMISAYQSKEPRILLLDPFIC